MHRDNQGGRRLGSSRIITLVRSKTLLRATLWQLGDGYHRGVPRSRHRAGQGTLAIPFAEKASHVTAVEPAEGMASVMREKMAEYGVSNIDIVQKRWEDVDVENDLRPPYDW